MKTVDKFRSDGWFLGNRKVKAKTKFYEGNESFFLFRQTSANHIKAKLEAVAGIQCASGFVPIPKTESQYAHKVKAKWESDDLNGIDPDLTPDNVYGTHVAENPDNSNDVTRKIDLFDGTVQ